MAKLWRHGVPNGGAALLALRYALRHYLSNGAARLSEVPSRRPAGGGGARRAWGRMAAAPPGGNIGKVLLEPFLATSRG
ncbi:MAG: hypothetical protein ACYCXN_15185, partial [Acidimicrobiales bacterium]